MRFYKNIYTQLNRIKSHTADLQEDYDHQKQDSLLHEQIEDPALC